MELERMCWHGPGHLRVWDLVLPPGWCAEIPKEWVLAFLASGARLTYRCQRKEHRRGQEEVDS
jgi:hypothetical protein